jgi:hypothetical protein
VTPDKKLNRHLRALHAQEVAAAPAQHAERTALCPPLAKLLTGHRDAHTDSCDFCRKVLVMQRRAQKPRKAKVLLAVETFDNPHPKTLAALGGKDVGAVKGGALQATWYPNHGERTLELRTRRTALTHQLLRCRLEPAGGGAVIEEVLLLIPGDNGWIVAEMTWDAALLYETLGATGKLTVTSATAKDLGTQEQARIRARVALELDPGVRAGWRAWAAAQGDDAPGWVAEIDRLARGT